MNNIAFLIGCEEYDHDDIPNLEGVNNDVESMKNALVRNCSCLPDKIFIINNQSDSVCDLSGSSILRFLFKKANKLRNEQFDNLFFYFSGHGYLSQDNMVCLMPRDSMIFPIQHGAITQKDIISVLKQFNYVKHIILFLDICQDELVSKGSIMEKSINPDYFPKGSIIFFSCFPRRSSYMVPPIGIDRYGAGSVFTKCLVESLNPESGCHTVNEISEFLKKKVPALSQELGFEQKPFTQLQDSSLGEVLITSHFNSGSVELSEAEKAAVAEFSRIIDVNNRNLCAQLGLEAEKTLLELCSSYVKFANYSRSTEDNVKAPHRKSDLHAIVHDCESFCVFLSMFKKRVSDSRFSSLRKIFKSHPLNINSHELDELEKEKSMFIEKIDYHRNMLLRDIAMLDKFKNLFSAHIREIHMYICSSEYAVKINTDKEQNVLLKRISDLRDTLQRCEEFLVNISKHEDFLANLIMQLQKIDQLCNLSFGKILLAMPDIEQPIDDMIESLNTVINSAKSYKSY